jgi:hypothetical protein
MASPSQPAAILSNDDLPKRRSVLNSQADTPAAAHVSRTSRPATHGAQVFTAADDPGANSSTQLASPSIAVRPFPSFWYEIRSAGDARLERASVVARCAQIAGF